MTPFEAPREEAARALAAGDLARAAERLGELEAALDALRGESELTEFPRGLVGYVAVGDRGHPRTDEEDPIANRRRLVLHLLELFPPEERLRREVLEHLARAQSALEHADRPLAQREVDAAHARLEAALAHG